MSYWKQKQTIEYKLNQFAINHLVPNYKTALSFIAGMVIMLALANIYLRTTLPEIHNRNYNNGYKQATQDIKNLKNL